eukprot:SAG31_NODE_953_length_10799_cov_4.245657_7_plen_167_part_00
MGLLRWPLNAPQLMLGSSRGASTRVCRRRSSCELAVRLLLRFCSPHGRIGTAQRVCDSALQQHAMQQGMPGWLHETHKPDHSPRRAMQTFPLGNCCISKGCRLQMLRFVWTLSASPRSKTAQWRRSTIAAWCVEIWTDRGSFSLYRPDSSEAIAGHFLVACRSVLA